MNRKLFLPLLLLGLTVAYPAAQATQERIDTDMNARIRKEGWDNSQIMRTMHFLTDVYGPRLTGSPNHENAAKWAVQQMEKWGMTNGKLEPFEFRTTAGVVPNGGWLNEKASGHILSPVRDNLVFEVLAWTPSTKGTVTADAVHLVTPLGPLADAPVSANVQGGGGAGRGNAPQRLGPTQEELDAYLKSIESKVRGGIVLVGPHAQVTFQEAPPPKRQTDEAMKGRFGGDPQAAPAGAGRGNRAGGPPAGRTGGAPPAAPAGPPRLTAAQVNAAVEAFLLKTGAGLRINDAGREHGQIRAFGHSAYDHTKTVPTVVLRNEDYGRITRILADGTPVRLEFNIVNNHYPAGKTSYNAIAEIRGTDKADEVVMLGGHLDSWHSATGATDNAAGSAIMMEAARILQTLGVKPRRTIRVALWGGEEQGLLGSRAYVKQHYGSFEDPLPEYSKFNGYFNIDSGTGRIRGMSVFGPPEAGAILREYFKQFEDFGIYGASTTSSRSPGGTDSTSFNAAGLPGIGASQDPIEYNSHTWHTNLDTYERILEDDMKKSAIAVASAVYHLAMRDQMLPRFTKENMPAPPPPPGAASTTGNAGAPIESRTTAESGAPAAVPAGASGTAANRTTATGAESSSPLNLAGTDWFCRVVQGPGREFEGYVHFFADGLVRYAETARRGIDDGPEIWPRAYLDRYERETDAKGFDGPRKRMEAIRNLSREKARFERDRWASTTKEARFIHPLLTALYVLRLEKGRLVGQVHELDEPSYRRWSDAAPDPRRVPESQVWVDPVDLFSLGVKPSQQTVTCNRAEGWLRGGE